MIAARRHVAYRGKNPDFLAGRIPDDHQGFDVEFGAAHARIAARTRLQRCSGFGQGARSRPATFRRIAAPRYSEVATAAIRDAGVNLRLRLVIPGRRA